MDSDYAARAFRFAAPNGDGNPARIAAISAAQAAATNSSRAASEALRHSAGAIAFDKYGPSNYFPDPHPTAVEESWEPARLDVVLANNLEGATVWLANQAGAVVPSTKKLERLYLPQAPAWEFWRKFITEMWNGTFTDWDLAFEVIKIDEADWEKGYEHIGELIAGIEAKMQGAGTSEPSNADLSMHRPNNVTQLFENAPQVRATFELSAATLSERFDLFYQMACPNDIIPLFEPLREMPATLARAADLLALGTRDKATEDALKDEVAKLRALLASVEAELKAAKLDIEELKKKPWYKSAWVVAGGTGSVIGAIVGTAWMVSGDELGPQERWDTLAEYWEFAFPREELKSEPLQYRLPVTTDI